jgi:hypothetical protein
MLWRNVILNGCSARGEAHCYGTISGRDANFLRDGRSKRNTRAERLARIKYAGFVTDCDVISIEEMDRDPFYTELIRPNGGGWAIGTIIPIPSNDLLVFNLERRYAEGPIEKELCFRLDPLRPHLARAGLLSVQLRMERARAMVGALEQINLPAAILRENGQVLAMNDSFNLLSTQIAPRAFNDITIQNPSSNALLKHSLAQSSPAEIAPFLRMSDQIVCPHAELRRRCSHICVSGCEAVVNSLREFALDVIAPVACVPRTQIVAVVALGRKPDLDVNVRIWGGLDLSTHLTPRRQVRKGKVR